MDALGAAACWVKAILENVLEFVWWRDDWKRTWSPVAWWLTAFSVVVLLLLLYSLVVRS
jgi:hypothetical protein